MMYDIILNQRYFSLNVVTLTFCRNMVLSISISTVLAFVIMTTEVEAIVHVQGLRELRDIQTDSNTSIPVWVFLFNVVK